MHFLRLLAILVQLLVAQCCFTHSAFGADLPQVVEQLAGADPDVATVVTELGVSADPKAFQLLLALEREELKVGEGRVYARINHRWLDARTFEAAQPPSFTRAPVLNNRARRALSTALARLRLLSPDRSVRYDAAEEIAKDPPSGMEPVLEQVSRAEQDAEIRALVLQGLAKLNLVSSDAKKRLNAVKVLGADVRMRSTFEALTLKGGGGVFNESDASVRAAAKEALSRIETKLFFTNLVGNLFYGLSLGSVLLLAALGLAITFGLMRVINMAHGEMLMIGAYSTFVVQNVLAKSAPGLKEYYLILAVPVAFAVCTLVGIILERTVIRFLYGRPLETLLATFGLSLLLIQTVRLIFGAQNVTVANPEWLSGGFELLPTVVLPYSRLLVIAFVLVVVTFVYLLLQRTSLGLKVRAVTQNRAMAAALGISTRRVDMWTFGLGSGVAGLGGVALSQLGNVGPELGQSFIVDSFMVVVVGGVGSVLGTVCGALGLGLTSKFLEPVAGAVLGKILLLVLLILFIQKRPQGIFALKGRAAEA